MQIKLLEISGVEAIRQAAVMPYQSKAKDLDKLAYILENMKGEE